MIKQFKFTHSREGTCIHEAAHAAIYYYFGFGRPLRGIEIYNDGEGMVFPTPYTIKDVWTIQAAIITALAGYAAEYKFKKIRLPYGLVKMGDSVNDYSIARDYFLLLKNSRHSSEIIFYLYEQDTRKLIRKKNIWAGIEELADALLINNSLDGGEVEAILSKHIITNQYGHNL